MIVVVVVTVKVHLPTFSMTSSTVKASSIKSGRWTVKVVHILLIIIVVMVIIKVVIIILVRMMMVTSLVVGVNRGGSRLRGGGKLKRRWRFIKDGNPNRLRRY